MMLPLALFFCLWQQYSNVRAFVVTPSHATRPHEFSFEPNYITKTFVSLSENNVLNEYSESAGTILSDEEINPIIRIGSGEKEKLINAFGIWTAFVSLLTCPVWYFGLKVIDTINNMNDKIDPHRAIYDGAGKIWSKVWLSLNSCYPTITGEVEEIDKHNGACLYVANHASWLDIPIICTALHPVFKFIAKGDLKHLPCIGDQLAGGKHILIDREDRRSQLRTFKQGVDWLKNGVPLMAFPEGKRSDDGRLMPFKAGMFAMAMKTGAPIVPITICNSHAVMPINALFPVQSGKEKLHLHIHPRIYVEGKSEEELMDSVRSAILSKLPSYQHPRAELV